MSEKCRACSKTVYVMDQQLSLPDGATFHKSCFRCRHCNTSLHPATFSSLHGALYCKAHFHLHLSQQKDLNNSKDAAAAAAPIAPAAPPAPAAAAAPPAADATPAIAVAVATPTPPATNATPTNENSTAPPAKITPAFTRSPSKAAMMFSGTQDKCVTCSKTVYPLEKVTVEEQAYHKSCFRCSHGGCAISPSNYAALEGVLYCKHHFKQLFKEKGSYNHIMKSASIKRTAAAAQPQAIASAALDA